MIKKYFLILVVFIFAFNNFLIAQTEKPIAEKGVLELREYNFDENIDLEGEWEFYWNELYDYYDFENKVYSPDDYITVPGSWTGTEVDGKIIPDTGFATYRLVIFANPNQTKNLMIRFNEVLTSYKVWLNNEVIIEVGKVGTTSNTSEPATRTVLQSINLNQERNVLIVQIANFSHRSNSFDAPPSIGKADNIMRGFTARLALDLIIIGLTFIMAFYHFGLFIMRRKNIAALAFALLTFILGVRFLFTGTYPLPFLMPQIKWQLIYRIAYITFYTIIPSFSFFFYVTFKEYKFKWVFRTIYIVSGLFLLTVFLPSIIFTKLISYYQYFTGGVILFSMILMVRNLILKKDGAVIFFFSVIFVFATGINDMLFYQEVINTTTLLPFGVFALILGQSLTLARIFTKSFVKNEYLTAKLDYQNQNLQEIVDKRTKELKRTTQDVLQKNEELQVQKEELQVQKEEISRQKELLEEHNKLFTDSINYASTIQRAVLPSNETIKKYFNSFIIFLPKDIVSGDFYWFNDVNKKYIYFVVGDCTGHGVPGAFISLIAMYLLNSVTIEKQIEDPKEILTELGKMFNEFLHKGQNSNKAGIDLGIIRFEKENMNKVVYSAAKTNMFIYDSADKSLIRHRGTRKSIGFVATRFSNKNIKFENLEIDLKDTQTIYCSTDGFIDQNNTARKRFGTTQFLKMLKENGNLPIQQQKILFMKKLENYKQNEEQRDDITFVGLSPKNQIKTYQ